MYREAVGMAKRRVRLRPTLVVKGDEAGNRNAVGMAWPGPIVVKLTVWAAETAKMNPWASPPRGGFGHFACISK